MNKNKHTLKEIFFTAVANYKKKDFKTAEITCYKILNIDPNHLAIRNINGNIHCPVTIPTWKCNILKGELKSGVKKL